MARFARPGFDFAMGLAGGFLNMPTGSPSVRGGAGEVVGKAARAKVDQMKTGMQFDTMRQQAATRHFAATGQRVTPPPAAAQKP